MTVRFGRGLLSAGGAALLLLRPAAVDSASSNLIIAGVFDGPLGPGRPKAVELYALADVPDLSRYGVGAANGHSGSEGQEFTLSGSASAGDFITITRPLFESEFVKYFGEEPTFLDNQAAILGYGDVAVELFLDGAVVDMFGDPSVDGTGTGWEYTDGWAYRNDGVGVSPSSTFNSSEWTFSGTDVLDGCISNDVYGCSSVFPYKTYGVSKLIITGVFDGPLGDGSPNVIELCALGSILDLSAYGIGVANEGGGSAGQEFTLGSGPATFGDCFTIVAHNAAAEFTSYFGEAPDFDTSLSARDGDDAVELFYNGVVVDVYGDPNVDGTGTAWEYLDGWAYRKYGSRPSSTFDSSEWRFSGTNAVDGCADNDSCGSRFPLKVFGPSMLVITGVMDGILGVIELYALADIPDLSHYGVGSANDGGGTDGQEFTLSGSAAAGDHITITSPSHAAEFVDYFGEEPTFTDHVATLGNGDDAVELFFNGEVVDAYGDPNVDGTGTAWDYNDGWAYRRDGTYPRSAFDGSAWTYSGTNAVDGCAENHSCSSVFPYKTYGVSKLMITGVFEGPLGTGRAPKVIELYALADIPDLSHYGLGSANDGGGTDGQEYTMSGSASAGDFITITRPTHASAYADYFGEAPTFTDHVATLGNGDDAVELFFNRAVVDVYGDPNVDGTGEAWEYRVGWAYRNTGIGVSHSSTFDRSAWTYSGTNAVDGCADNDSCGSQFPFKAFTIVTLSPTSSPTTSPTKKPTDSPTTSPTKSGPTASPSTHPTSSPTKKPTDSPTASPTKAAPSSNPTSNRYHSESPSCTPSSLPKETIYQYYPDFGPNGMGCKNDGDQPNYMYANPSSYLYSTLDRCCRTHFGWAYTTCMGKVDNICANNLFYPDWSGANQGCLDDGNEASYMAENPEYFLYASKEECCRRNYIWKYDDCVGDIRYAQKGLFYPDFDSLDDVCRNDGLQPSYMDVSPDWWMYNDLKDCCAFYYPWNYKDCISSHLNAAPVASPAG